jgi:uncharacterized protein YjiS (DUF1127 family)
MAFFSLNRSAHQAAPSIFNGLSAGNVFAHMASSLRLWNEKRVTRAELEMLSDRELSDIGLSRSDITRIVEDLR